MVRLQKFLAEAGVASRRASEEIIVQARVSVNGKVVTELGTKVDPARDQIIVDGKLVRTKRKLYVALHKPAGCVCSRKDERDRPTIYELLPPDLWHGALAAIVRLFPGLTPDSYCKDYGDAPPLALEKVFNQPLQGFETLLERSRSLIVIDWSANREIHSAIRDLMDRQKG